MACPGQGYQRNGGLLFTDGIVEPVKIDQDAETRRTTAVHRRCGAPSASSAVADASISVRIVSHRHSTTLKDDAKGWHGAARTMAKKMVSDRAESRTEGMRTPVYWLVEGVSHAVGTPSSGRTMLPLLMNCDCLYAIA